MTGSAFAAPGSVLGGAARIARGTRRLLAWLAAWRWGAPAARVAMGVLGLLVLAAIGRSALAGGSTPLTSAPPSPAAPALAPMTVPSTSAPPSPPTSASASTPTSTAEPTPASSSSPSTDRPRRATPDDPVILNQAAFEDLRRLPGIGPKRAESILALRQRLGRFRQVEDLLKVKGIGRATLRKLRPLVRIDAPAPAPAPVVPPSAAQPT